MSEGTKLTHETSVKDSSKVTENEEEITEVRKGGFGSTVKN